MMDRMRNNDERVLRFGLSSGGWGPLFPAQQSSLYAAIIISHVFDSLVGVDNTGGFIPNLAKTWDINKDFTIYTFVIDTERKFSDGTPLTAQIYRDSLLESLRLEAGATNQSALDVLYALKGYKDFSKTGNIAGLEVEGKNVLRMHFERPFRGAIGQLSGTRYGAYQKKNGVYLGTGPYVFDRTSDNSVDLSVNPHYPTSLAIKHIKITADGINALYSGKIDVALAPFYSKPHQDKNINVGNEKLSSLLELHWVIVVNGMHSRIFADNNLRKAAQYLIYNYFITHYSNASEIPFFSSDIQFYPPLFPGRLSEGKAGAIIEEGKQFIEALRLASEEKPIVCLNRAIPSFDYCHIFEINKIKTKRLEGDFDHIKRTLYKTYDADLVSYSVSYAGADPDGIYHFLGHNGAIWTPLASRSRVESLIEEGRLLTDWNNIDDHYKKTSVAILEEVPVIHLGSQKLFLNYNPDILEPAEKVVAKCKALDVTLFKWR